ncbi:MAG: carboxyl transferase domain-containing protein, partial [Bdellovibrionota bacterium]
MAILRSHVQTGSAEFRANAEHHQKLVKELEEKLAQARQGGGSEAREKHEKRGKLFVRDRVAKLLDPGTPFLELSPLAANGLYDDAIHGAGMITGIGRVEGRECMVVCNDSTIK